MGMAANAADSHNAPMRTYLIVATAIAALAGCASSYVNSPHYDKCVEESGVPAQPWYSVGTVRAELLRMCVERKQARN